MCVCVCVRSYFGLSVPNVSRFLLPLFYQLEGPALPGPGGDGLPFTSVPLRSFTLEDDGRPKESDNSLLVSLCVNVSGKTFLQLPPVFLKSDHQNVFHVIIVDAKTFPTHASLPPQRPFRILRTSLGIPTSEEGARKRKLAHFYSNKNIHTIRSTKTGKLVLSDLSFGRLGRRQAAGEMFLFSTDSDSIASSVACGDKTRKARLGTLME